MITVRGWHGKLSSKLSKVMDSIAMPISPNVEWEIEDTLEGFADKWQRPFLAYPADKPRKDESCSWQVFITDYNSFGAR